MSSTTMKRLAAMQLWPLLIVRAFAACRRRLGGIDVGEHDERVGAAQLEHRLLQAPPRLRGHLHAGAVAAGEGHGPHHGVG